ncbi:MAG: hypothetical protein HUJ71_09125 [Pseudobutyrivibrio sp.]|nr:hypothetical protein [Pseudobutyrivibrio sp.]
MEKSTIKKILAFIGLVVVIAGICYFVYEYLFADHDDGFLDDPDDAFEDEEDFFDDVIIED